MDIKIDLTDVIVVDVLSATPGGIVLQLAVTSAGVALGTMITWAAPKALHALGKFGNKAVSNVMNINKR